MKPIELQHLIIQFLEQYQDDHDAFHNLPPIMIWSGPGIGKSSIVRSVATELGIDFIDVRLAQREPVDIRGLPVPDKETATVKWFVPDEWPRDPKSRGIIFFDELSAADRSLQVAAYELILDRRLGNLYTVPDGWYICAAGNRSEDRAVAVPMSSALANRFLHVDLEPDITSWAAWAFANKIHPSVIGFLRFRPEWLFHQANENLERGWPTPRSWERVSAVLKSTPALPEGLLFEAITGLVGATAGAEFRAFYSLGKNVSDVAKMMRNPTEKLIIPKQPDQQYALCAAMAHYLWQGATPAEEKTLLDGFFRISLSLTSDFALMALTDALGTDENRQIHRERCQKIFAHPQYAAWRKRHGSSCEKYREDRK